DFIWTPLQVLQASCKESVPVDQVYKRYSEIGIHYGPAFQAIRELWTGAEGALSRIELSVPSSDFQLHPVLLDAAFHTLAAAIPTATEGSTFLPISIDSLHLYQMPFQEVWSYVQLNRTGSGSIIEVDVQVMDASGQPLAAIKKLKLKEVQQAALKSAAGALK